MANPTFFTPDLTTFCRLDTLDLTRIGQHITAHKAVLKCRPNTVDDWCRRCGARTPRPRPQHGRRSPGLDWALRALVVDHDTVSVIAAKLAVSWHTSNSAILAEGHRLLINDHPRFDGVSVIGVDEHVWRHTRRGGQIRHRHHRPHTDQPENGPGTPAGHGPGRSKQAFKQWLGARPEAWRDGIEVVAMDGFAGFKTAAAEELPDAAEVMDPFHIVELAGDALDEDEVRRRIQQETTGHRGRAKDPLYRARRNLHTSTSLLTRRQQETIVGLFADPNRTEVEVTWAVYQDIVAAYRSGDRREG